METKRNQTDESTDRAVSPVIGVILMVAITVILAAVIAAFVLDLGSGQSANPSAGITFQEDDGNEVVVQINNIDRLDSAWVSVEGQSWQQDIDPAEVGETATVTSGDSSNTGEYTDGDRIQVIGEYQGTEAVITTYQTSD